MRAMTLGVAAVAAVLAIAGPAAAASKPTVATSAATAVAQTSATLHASINPQGQATTWHFQFGTTTSYGGQTGPGSAGAGTTAVKRDAVLTGLKPATTYHFRVVATNATGTTFGADRAVTTKKQPLGLSLAASPNPAPFGGPITLTGTLTGTGNAAKAVVLQQRAFPYTAAWANVGNQQVTSATGGFSFPVLSLTANTQFRVLTTGTGAIASPIVLAGSAAVVNITASSMTPKARSLVRFAGTIRPKEDGALYALQKQKGTAWVTIGGSSLRSYSADASKYAIRSRIAHSGNYRIFVGVADGAHQSSSSRTLTIKVRSRYS
jgi:hypothetical protein